MERMVTRTDEVKDAAAVLVNAGINLFFTSEDNTVIIVQSVVARIMQEIKIPCFTNYPNDIDRSTLLFCRCGNSNDGCLSD
jgi:hypothetical protein